MRIKRLLIVLATIFLLGMTNVKANEIKSIDVDMYINKDGSADITEKWNVDGSDGTEWYHPFRDLGDTKITNYTVTMDNRPLEYKTWNINESLQQKRGYYGINYTSTDTELCFGKYDYEPHVFVLKYHVDNLIFNTSDAQVLYWTFFSKFQNVNFKAYSITIKSYYEFPDSLDVWGYGYKGYAYVNSGVASFSNSEDSTMNGNYVVGLIKFPTNTFETNFKLSRFSTFDQVLKAANEGTTKYDYGSSSSSNSNSYTKSPSFFNNVLRLIGGLFTYIVIAAGAVFGGIKISQNGYGYKNNRTIDKNNVPNFRDIPCEKNIYYANALMFLNNFGYNETNILGAIILKWIKQEKVTFIKQNVGIFKKEQNCLDLRKEATFTAGSEEEKLYNIMKEASGDGILEPKEFGKWAKRHYDQFFRVFKNLKNNEVTRLQNEGHIYPRKDKEECKKKNVMDDKIYEDSVQLWGLKKFLQEFASMDTKEAIEVHLWDEYLMFAYLFGIADKVAKQFKNLYPELMEQNPNMDYTTIMMINSFSATTVSAATSARSAAESYSGGGGGFSVGGGGGGSIGGGGFSGGGSR